MSRRPLVGALLLCGVLLLAGCASLPRHSAAEWVAPPTVGLVGYCSTTYPEQCGLSSIQSYQPPRFYKVQLGGGGISGYPLNITSPSNDECLLLQGPPWVIVNGACSGSSSTAWANITGGTNTSAVMLVGAGSSLGYTSTGIVNANEVLGLAFPALVNGDCLGAVSSMLSWVNCGSGGGVSSFTGDGTLLTNSASTGAVTATLGTTGVGYGVWGNTGSSSGAPAYHAMSSYPAAAFPTLNQTTTGTAAGLTSYPTLCSGGEFSQGLSSGSNNCGTPTGSGTVNSGTSGQLAYYASTGTAVSGATVGQGLALSGGTLVTTQPERTVTSMTDTISCTTDSGGVILYNASSTVTVSVPQATGSCASGFGFTVENAGAGTATLTPTTSTIQGLSSLAIPTNSGCSLWSDGTNYQVAACRALATLTYAEGSVTTVTPNCAFGTTTATITGAATIDTPTGCTPYNGQRILLEIQSASSYTYTASGYITGSTTGAWPASSTGSSKDDHFVLLYDGYLGTPGWVLEAYNTAL